MAKSARTIPTTNTANMEKNSANTEKLGQYFCIGRVNVFFSL